MGRVLMRAGGGLAAADRAKLTPENIREGVVLFEGTPHEIVGTAKVMPDGAYISSFGVSFNGESASLGPGQSTYLYAVSTPEFDITTYNYAGFRECTTTGNASRITVTGQVCQVLQNGAVVASGSGVDRTIDVSGITGYVTFRFYAYFACSSSSNYYPVSISLGDIYLER